MVVPRGLPGASDGSGGGGVPESSASHTSIVSSGSATLPSTRWSKARLNCSARATPAKRNRTGASPIRIERPTRPPVCAALSKLLVSSSIDLSSAPSAVSGAGRGMRPSLRVDLVNRVEQDDVLHVGERRESRRHKGGALSSSP